MEREPQLSVEAFGTLPLFSVIGTGCSQFSHRRSSLLLTSPGRTSPPPRGVKTHQSARHLCTLGESLSPTWVGLPGQEQLRQRALTMASTGDWSPASVLESVHPWGLSDGCWAGNSEGWLHLKMVPVTSNLWVIGLPDFAFSCGKSQFILSPLGYSF